MICTLTKLNWQKLSGKQCGGWIKNISLIKDIRESVEGLLSVNKCLGDHQNTRPIDKFDLLTNRICPYKVKGEAFDNIDVCQNHFVSILSIFEVIFFILKSFQIGNLDNQKSIFQANNLWHHRL